MEPMRPSHQLFLQSFMCKAILKAQEVKHLFSYICQRFDEPYDEDHLRDFVNTINHHIKPIHMEIRKAICEETGANYYGLVNTAESDITLASSDYTANELELFKKIVEKIVFCDNGLVSSTEVLNLTETLDKNTKKMRMKEAQDLLEHLQRDKWIKVNDHGAVSLSTRAILELEQYIKEQFPNTATLCHLCNKICLQGQCCVQCDVKIHRKCVAVFFANQEPKCPECYAAWIHEIPQKPARQKGASATQSQPDPSQSQASQAEPQGRKRKSRRQ